MYDESVKPSYRAACSARSRISDGTRKTSFTLPVCSSSMRPLSDNVVALSTSLVITRKCYTRAISVGKRLGESCKGAYVGVDNHSREAKRP